MKTIKYKKSFKSVIFLIFSFKVRLITIGAVITFAQKNPLVQFSFISFSSLVLIALVGVVRPFESDFDNRLELANEFTILIVLAWLTC